MPMKKPPGGKPTTGYLVGKREHRGAKVLAHPTCVVVSRAQSPATRAYIETSMSRCARSSALMCLASALSAWRWPPRSLLRDATAFPRRVFGPVDDAHGSHW